jgi:transposase
MHDTVKKTWRHLDFFQHQAFLHARVARIERHLRRAPRQRNMGTSEFRLHASVRSVCHDSRYVHAGRRCRSPCPRARHAAAVHRPAYVEKALVRMGLGDLRHAAIDETTAKRGQNYITLFVGIDARKVVYITEGNDADTVARFSDHIDVHNSDASRIKEVYIDMSAVTWSTMPSTRSGALRTCTADISGSRTRAASPMRRAKRSMFKTRRNYRLRLAFQEFYSAPPYDWGEFILDRWYSWAIRSRLELTKKVARTIKHRRGGILRWFDSKIAIDLIECINSLVQAAEARG